MKATFAFSNAYRQLVFVNTGKRLPTQQTLEIPVDQLSAESRTILTNHNPKLDEVFPMTIPGALDASGYTRYELLEVSLIPGDADTWDIIFKLWNEAYEARRSHNAEILQKEFDKKLDRLREKLAKREGESFAFQDHERQHYETCIGVEEAVQISKQLQQLKQEQLVEENRIAKEKRLAEEAEKQRVADEKKDWITQYGSPSLKKKFQADYDCQREYVLQRAKQEYPGYLVDFQDNGHWSPRSCPSEAAFQEAQRVNGQVVWVKRLPSADEEAYYDFEEGEGVVVKFLGKYDLIRLFPEE